MVTLSDGGEALLTVNLVTQVPPLFETSHSAHPSPLGDEPALSQRALPLLALVQSIRAHQSCEPEKTVTEQTEVER